MANLISALRIGLTVPYGFLLYQKNFSGALIVAILIAATDLLDGYIARKTKTTSTLGTIFDTIGDSLFILISWILFFYIGMINALLLGLLVGERFIRGAFLLAMRVKDKKWNLQHLASDKMIGFVHFLSIGIILVSAPHASSIIGWIVANVVYLGVFFAFYQRYHGDF